ncbi:MAG TPA: TetR/AcrR family transcriptional regulator [Bacillota bacterium]|nr:TetR/AcrR family transcriptional regulator [Bacillota bacterium]
MNGIIDLGIYSPDQKKGRKPPMYETFEKLPESKRQQILQVCIEEFVLNGYVNTSTNTIVSRLGISKGVLFLYFKNKKNLYLYIVEYLSKLLTDEYLREFGGKPIVTIEVFDDLGEFYKRLLRDKPEQVLFMLEAFLKAPEEIREDVETRHSLAHNYVLQYLNKADFREEVEIQLVVDLMHMISYHLGHLIFEEYINKNIAKTGKEGLWKSIDYFAEIFGKYMDILKYGVYKRTQIT